MLRMLLKVYSKESAKTSLPLYHTEVLNDRSRIKGVAKTGE
jgi:hypothetical protein